MVTTAIQCGRLSCDWKPWKWDDYLPNQMCGHKNTCRSMVKRILLLLLPSWTQAQLPPCRWTAQGQGFSHVQRKSSLAYRLGASAQMLAVPAPAQQHQNWTTPVPRAGLLILTCSEPGASPLPLSRERKNRRITNPLGQQLLRILIPHTPWFLD